MIDRRTFLAEHGMFCLTFEGNAWAANAKAAA